MLTTLCQQEQVILKKKVHLIFTADKGLSHDHRNFDLETLITLKFLELWKPQKKQTHMRL